MRWILTSFFIALLGWTQVSEAELRRRFEDETVVERSDLIVMARILPESIVRVDHEAEPGRGSSWEYHATLAVTEVLKGSYDQEQLPMVFDYGIAPVVGRAGSYSDPPDGRDSTRVVEIRDYGSSVVSQLPLIPDAREDTLWFLRRQMGRYWHRSGLGKYRVRDPEDIRLAGSKDYLLSYLRGDPEDAVRKLAAEGASIEGGRRYLDYKELERIRQIEDLEERFDRLLPFFLGLMSWDGKWAARDAMAECGTVCAKGLEPVFRNLEPGIVRQQIMRLWADLSYGAAVPLLIETLEEAESFWAGEDLPEGWWNKAVGSAQTRKRREIYGDVHSAVYVLSLLPDPAARPILEATRARWRSFENPQIPEAAERALSRMPP